MDYENTSVETEEVAELPEENEETGVEEQEAAEPAPEQSETPDTDAAWAKMRREKEAAQSELEALKAELDGLKAANEARDAAFSRLTGKDEDAEISVIAEVTGMSEDEVAEIYRREEESAQKDILIEQLQEQVTSIEAERLMQADLEKLRKIDPSLGSLDELGDSYIEYIGAGLSPERAYWAVKAEQGANMATPPKEVGKVASGTVEKEYFTEAEIDAMSSEQLTKHWKKVMATWDRNAKR